MSSPMRDEDISRIKVGNRHRKDLGDIDELARSIEDVGLLHPIVVTPKLELIAGQRRLVALKKLQRKRIPVHVVDLEAITLGEAAENLQRKSLTPSELVAIGQAIEQLERGKAKERQRAGGKSGGQASGKLPLASVGKTRDRVAKSLGISGKTYEATKAVVASGDHKLIAACDRGEISVSSAARKIAQKMNRESAAKTAALTGTFSVVYGDPPWQYGASSVTGGADQHYPTMKTENICKIPVRDHVTKNAVLFLWATNPLLPDALQVMSAWGFEYKTCLVWVKPKATTGLGVYVRGKHELLLIGTRGSMIPVSRPVSVIEAPSSEHSKKPESVYGLIEKMYPDQRSMEMFARKTRKGWISHGNEIDEATSKD